MAMISFEQANELESANTGSRNGDFSFFTLRNDGDEAIVRFPYDSTNQFEIYTVHDVDIVSNGATRSRKVSCLRAPKKPVQNCPLCEAGIKSRNTFLIKMIQYVTDSATGAITPTPVVWERSILYATRLKSLIDEYGPLSDCVFKIKRCGAAGSRDTTYEIYYGSPKMYPDNIYVKDFSSIESIKFSGYIVMEKNFDDLHTYLQTGAFPQSALQTVPQQTPAVTQPTTPAPQYVPQTPVTHQYVPQQAPTTSQPTYQEPPVAHQEPTVVTPPAEPNIPQQTYVPYSQPQQAAPSTPQTSTPVGAPPSRANRYY